MDCFENRFAWILLLIRQKSIQVRYIKVLLLFRYKGAVEV